MQIIYCKLAKDTIYFLLFLLLITTKFTYQEGLLCSISELLSSILSPWFFFFIKTHETHVWMYADVYVTNRLLTFYIIEKKIKETTVFGKRI